MIEARTLAYSWGNREILRGLDLSVGEGETYTILGRTGSGKSTLLALLAGLREPAGGTLRVHSTAPREARAAIVFQDGGLFPWKRLVENVELGLRARGEPRGVAREAALASLASLGLAERAYAFPAALSGGEIQRGALCRSLVLDPDLLLADEPAAALDAVTREQVQDQLLSVAQSRGLTLVVVTHNIDEAAALGQRIGMLHEGRIVDEVQNAAFSFTPERYSSGFALMCRELRDRFVRATGGVS